MRIFIEVVPLLNFVDWSIAFLVIEDIVLFKILGELYHLIFTYFIDIKGIFTTNRFETLLVMILFLHYLTTPVVITKRIHLTSFFIIVTTEAHVIGILISERVVKIPLLSYRWFFVRRILFKTKIGFILRWNVLGNDFSELLIFILTKSILLNEFRKMTSSPHRSLTDSRVKERIIDIPIALKQLVVEISLFLLRLLVNDLRPYFRVIREEGTRTIERRPLLT